MEEFDTVAVLLTKKVHDDNNRLPDAHLMLLDKSYHQNQKSIKSLEIHLLQKYKASLVSSHVKHLQHQYKVDISQVEVAHPLQYMTCAQFEYENNDENSRHLLTETRSILNHNVSLTNGIALAVY